MTRLVEFMDGHSLVEARFANSDRTICYTLWKHDEDESLTDFHIEVKPDNKQWEKVLEHKTVDEIHFATHSYIKQQRDSFRKLARDVLEIEACEQFTVEEDGTVIFDPNSFEDRVDSAIDLLFNEEGQKDFTKNETEKLFSLKLKLFELPFIKNSKKRTLKAELRKTSTPTEAIMIALRLYDESRK